MSEALLFAEHGENILCTKIVLNVRSNFCTLHVFPRFELGIFKYSMNNLSSYCGLLVDAKIRTSVKDLPVLIWRLFSSYTLMETYGEEKQSILNTAELWKQNISVFIGPQETCNHEARMAASFNLPMISHFCSDAKTSNKVK